MHTCLIYIYLYQIHIYITKQVFFFPDFFEFSYDFPIQNYVNKLYHTRQHVQGATTLSKKTPLKKKKKPRKQSPSFRCLWNMFILGNSFTLQTLLPLNCFQAQGAPEGIRMPEAIPPCEIPLTFTIVRWELGEGGGSVCAWRRPAAHLQ